MLEINIEEKAQATRQGSRIIFGAHNDARPPSEASRWNPFGVNLVKCHCGAYTREVLVRGTGERYCREAL